MSPKKDKKQTTKKPLPRIPGLPKDAKVKVIEITPKTFLLPLLVIAIIWSVWTAWMSSNGEQIKYNDKIGLNEMRQNYQSGAYEQIVVSGNELRAEKPAFKNNVNGKDFIKRDVDRLILPENVNITDIGLSDPKNPTKIVPVDTSWTRTLKDMA